MAILPKNGKRKVIILRSKCYKRQKRGRFCKVEFTKFTKFVFFLITIRFFTQKCIIFAPDFKTATKLQLIFNINKLNFKIMKKVFLIVMIDKKTNKNLGALYEVFETEKLALMQRERYQNQTQHNIRFVVIKVDMICQKEYIK